MLNPSRRGDINCIYNEKLDNYPLKLFRPDDLLLSTFVMLIPRPVFRHGLHQLLPVNSFSRLFSVGVNGSPPRSSSELRHEDESSKLEQRRLRRKQPQLSNISMTRNSTVTTHNSKNNCTSHPQHTSLSITLYSSIVMKATELILDSYTCQESLLHFKRDNSTSHIAVPHLMDHKTLHIHCTVLV